MTDSNGIAGGVGRQHETYGTLNVLPVAATEEQRAIVGASTLYPMGDARLMWVNEGDLDMLMFASSRLAAPAEVDAQVEAMAGAMFDDWMGDDVGLHSSPPWPELDDDIREQWRSSARAALRALSAQPTGGQ